MAKTSGMPKGRVPDAVNAWIDERYPNARKDGIAWNFDRSDSGEIVVTLRLVYCDSQSDDEVDVKPDLHDLPVGSRVRVQMI